MEQNKNEDMFFCEHMDSPNSRENGLAGNYAGHWHVMLKAVAPYIWRRRVLWRPLEPAGSIALRAAYAYLVGFV